MVLMVLAGAALWCAARSTCRRCRWDSTLRVFCMHAWRCQPPSTGDSGARARAFTRSCEPAVVRTWCRAGGARFATAAARRGWIERADSGGPRPGMESIINSRAISSPPTTFGCFGYRSPTGVPSCRRRAQRPTGDDRQRDARARGVPGRIPSANGSRAARANRDKPSWKTVVGVVADVRSAGPAEPARPEFYLPVMQIPDVAWTWTGRTMNVMARSTALTRGSGRAIRQAVKDLDSTLPVYAIRTMDDGLRQTLAQARFNTMLMTLLGSNRTGARRARHLQRRRLAGGAAQP